MATDTKFLCYFVRGESEGGGPCTSLSGKKQQANGMCATVGDDVCMLHASLKRGSHAMPLCVPPQTHLLLTPQRKSLALNYTSNRAVSY